MKVLFISLLSFLLLHKSDAQIFKKIGTKIKEDIEWRAQRKAGQKIDQGLDSLIQMPKKIIGKKPAQGTKNTAPGEQGQSKPVKGSGKTMNAVPAEGGELSTKDGHVTLILSADKIFTGSSILISGESIKYKNFTQVQIKVSGPSPTDVRNITLGNDGKYTAAWNASDKTGEYTVTVTSSDKKATQTATFRVEEIDIVFADDWPEDNKKEIKIALDNLEAAVSKAETGISPKNKAELRKKMDDLKGKVKEVLKLYNDLGKANKEMIGLVKKGKRLPPNLAGNLSELNTIMANQASQMKQLNEMADHKPPDNSICEYLVMVNEACAAFSTFTNVFSKSIGTIIKNITLDKAVPKVAGGVNEAAGGISAPYDFPLKEASKIYATSKFDAQSLTEKLGKAGIAGDIMQFATEVLLKIYCEVFTGSFTHGYTIDFRNSKGETWWKYGVDMKAAFTLRYPKNNIPSTIIKMKGNLEGNATRFSFFEDVEKEDEFRKGTKGKMEVVPIKTFIPLSVSVATSEWDVMGFGAIARGLATPAYFNILIHAEYDVDGKKIKIFINNALVDFFDHVANQFVFLMIGPDLIPYPKKMTFPIHKARLTINGVVSDHNEFTVETDAKGNESFTGKGNRHIGDNSSVRETDLNFTISAKKE